MLAKFAVVLTAALAVAAQTTTNRCNTGTIQCCESVQDAKSQDATTALGIVGVLVQGITAQVGLTCSLIDVVGISGNSCSAQPACCTGQNYYGAVVLGCNPINLNV